MSSDRLKAIRNITSDPVWIARAAAVARLPWHRRLFAAARLAWDAARAARAVQP